MVVFDPLNSEKIEYAEGKITSSHSLEALKRKGKIRKPIQILTVDNFAASVVSMEGELDKEGNPYPEWTFQVLKWWSRSREPFSKEILRILKDLENSDVVEFRLGTYKKYALGR